ELHETTTDDDGRFVFPDLADGHWFISASQPGFLPLGDPAPSCILPCSPRLTKLRATLYKPIDFSLTIVDEDGAPAEDARVQMNYEYFPDGKLRIRDPLSGVPEAFTNASGVARFEGLCPGRGILTLERDGYARSHENVDFAAPDVRLTLH